MAHQCSVTTEKPRKLKLDYDMLIILRPNFVTFLKKLFEIIVGDVDTEGSSSADNQESEAGNEILDKTNEAADEINENAKKALDKLEDAID